MRRAEPTDGGEFHARQFVGWHRHRIIKGVGHNVPQEAPGAFVRALVEVDTYPGEAKTGGRLSPER